MADTIKVVIRADELWPVADLDDDTTGYDDPGLADCLIEVTREEFDEYRRIQARLQEMSGDFLSRRKR